jgi:hypothetical protein
MINLANDQFRVPRRDHRLPPTRRSPMLVAVIALLPVALTDCGSLPQSGPSTATVRDQYLGKGADVGIIEIDRAAIDALAVRPVDMLTQHFEDRRPPAELRAFCRRGQHERAERYGARDPAPAAGRRPDRHDHCALLRASHGGGQDAE